MATMLGSLLVELGLDSGTFKSGLTAAQKELRKAQAGFEKVGQGLTEFGAKMSLAVTTPMIALSAKAVQGFVEQEQAIADVNAALASMGDASGKTSAELTKMADAMEMRSLFDAEVILKQVTANLLTFGNIAGREFDRAQQAAVDMATRLGGEPQAAAIMLGKALNDPIKGITALTRVGVQFTEQQKSQIAAMQAAGNTAGAQGVILAEVERQFKGAAQAAADATPWRQAQVAIGQAMDAIGKAVLPIIKPASEAIASLATAFASLPEPMQKGIVIAAALTATLGPLLMIIGGLVSSFGALLPVLVALAPAFAAMRVAALALMTNPAFLGFAAVVAGIYLAWKNWDKITAIVKAVYDAVKTWIVDRLNKVWDGVIGKVELVKTAFYKLYDAVVGHSYIPDMVEGIAAEMKRLNAVMVSPAEKATTAATEAFEAMASEVQPILDRLFPDMAALNKYRAEGGAIDRAVAGGAISAGTGEEARRRLAMEGRESTFLGNFLAGTDDPLGVDAARAAFDKFTGAAKNAAKEAEVVNVRIVKSFKDMANDTVSALQQVAGAVKGGGFLDILGSVINLGLQLGSIGAFGKKVQTNINVPKYARGTRFHPGGMALVGERGPELVNMPRGASVIPNSALNQQTQIQVIPSPMFDVVVDGRVQRAAPAIVGAGAQVAQRQASYRASRRLG